MTEYFDFKNGIIKENLKKCARIILDNGTVVFPTETVYGIGANALSKEAVKKIYLAKGRQSDNPLIVHISNKDIIKKLASEINDVEQLLIDNFMPGPFTLILKRTNIVPDCVTAGLDTVGIRMPDNKIANQFIKLCGVPIAAPSANISGRPSGTNIEDIKNELDGKVDAIIDAGLVDIGIESTVVKVIDGVPNILRPGKITKEDIKEIVGTVKVNDKVFNKINKGEKVESPGMKYRHYAPKTKCVLVYSDDENEQITKVQKILKQQNNACVLGFKEHETKINCKKYITIGSKLDLSEVSKNIYKSLRQADKLGVDLIIIEGVSKTGLGLAIMNRLLRACEYNVI